VQKCRGGVQSSVEVWECRSAGVQMCGCVRWRMMEGADEVQGRVEVWVRCGGGR
jgi:hypothetical protein